MKRALFVAAVLAALGVMLVPAATAGPDATITFVLSSDGHGCTLTITSSKDISNFTVNGVKTELTDGTTTLVLSVSPGDVITVKAGRTVATFTVPLDHRCVVPHNGDDHDGDGDHDGDDHDGHDHDGDGQPDGHH